MTSEIKSTKAKSSDWDLADVAPESFFRKLSDYPKVIAQMFLNRGVTEPAAAERFLAPDYDRDLEDPSKLKDLDLAAEEIEKSIATGSKILVHGDYDADGLTAAALLANAIERLGGKVSVFVPDRYLDGYGVTTANLVDFRKGRTDLVVTVDCGISCAREIRSGRKDGLRIVVTDHHEPPAEIPEAEAVVNPKRPGDRYPNKELTGAGVAFKLAQALFERSKLPAKEKEAAEKWLLDLVAVGTIADLAELKGENRALAHFGLTVLRKSPRPGIQALLTAAGIAQEGVTAGTVGYAIAPRLNAAGRLGAADDALKLLMATDSVEAKRAAEKLEGLNQERRELTEQAVTEVREALGQVEDEPILIIDGPWKSGIAGLIAGRLSQVYGRPALVLGQDGDSYVGSARSNASFHITEALQAHAELLERFGGHAGAAGLTVKADKLERLKRSLRQFAGQRLRSEDFMVRRSADAVISPDELTPEICKYLGRFEPFGRGNPRPALVLRKVLVLQSGTVGAGGDHLKLLVGLPDGRNLAAIAFGAGDRALEAKRGASLDLLGRPEMNHWNGRSNLEWRIEDFRSA